ncbi:Sestrin-1 [Actinomortierella ambigua]|nr:Sestrin-1 [Actinomortierella ambigua]
MAFSPTDDSVARQVPSTPSSFTYSRFRAVLFNDILDANPATRSHALDNIVNIVTGWARVVTDARLSESWSQQQQQQQQLEQQAGQGNPTPPFSPTTDLTPSTSTIDGTLCSEPSLEKLSISTATPLSDEATAATETSTTAVPPPLHPSSRSRTNSTMSATSPVEALPGRAIHSASSSTSAAGAGASMGLTSPDWMGSCLNAGEYHFQNDPDIHLNREVPDKLSPLEERVAEVDEAARLLRHHILTILRFTVNCPYKDVKARLLDLVAHLETMDVPIPRPIHNSASFFIDPKDIYLLDSPESSQCASPNLSLSKRNSSSSSLSTLPPIMTRLPRCEGTIPDPATKELIIRTFLNHGRASNLFRVLAYFPTFWERFEASQNIMMNGPGPIPKAWRCYVAIMAASQFSCQYLVSMMKLDYLTSGGDPTWLNGLTFTTQKIRNLAKLNSLMAHQPWRLKPRHIQELVSREINHNPHNVWTISELAQVMVILSSIHSLSMLVTSCGIVPEIDMVGGTFVDLSKYATKDEAKEDHSNNGTSRSESMSPMTLLPSPAPESDGTMLPSIGRPYHFHIALPPAMNSRRTYDEATSKLHTAELISRLLQAHECCGYGEDADDLSDSLEFPKGYEEFEDDFPQPEPRTISPSSSSVQSDGTTSATDSRFRPVQENMSRFLDMSCQVESTLFDCRSKQYSVFRADDFRWEDDASSLLSKCLPELFETLEDEFNESLNFTDHSFFDQGFDQHEGGVDTFPFRQAIWYYTLRLFGLMFPDYDYRNLSKFMNKTLANYIRKSCHYITLVEASPPTAPTSAGLERSPSDVGSVDSVDVAPSPSSPSQPYPSSYTATSPGIPLGGMVLSDLHKIDKNDFDNMGFELRPEERCHINIIVMEAAKQAKLLYALRALDRWERKVEGRLGPDEQDEDDEGDDERL